MRETFDKIYNNLYYKGYSLLIFPMSKTDYSEVERDPLYLLCGRIKDSISELDDFISGRTATPIVIEQDKEFVDIPGIYLIDEDHIHTQVYVHRDDKWYKLKLNDEYVYL